MPQTKSRTIEAFRLTISGLPENISYNEVFKAIARHSEEYKYTYRSKYIFLKDCNYSKRQDALQLRFISYKEGEKPDVIDTTTNMIQDNPLPSNFESVKYTHVLGIKDDRYTLMIERNAEGGVSPKEIIFFIQYMCNTYWKKLFGEGIKPLEEIVVNIEPIPGPSFIEHLKGLERIKEATVRIVKKNPSWKDFSGPIGELSDRSNAAKADITIVAPRGKGLKKEDGICLFIQEAYSKRELDWASVTGDTVDKKRITYKTSEDSIKEKVSVNIDSKGQIIATEIYDQLFDLYPDNIDNIEN
ncbi:MAG: hypothetical protein Q4D62_12485 [Planctomycetia bacterium]|nr:hypothetical protein [Planctomycetia bacterium]